MATNPITEVWLSTSGIKEELNTKEGAEIVSTFFEKCSKMSPEDYKRQELKVDRVSISFENNNDNQALCQTVAIATHVLGLKKATPFIKETRNSVENWLESLPVLVAIAFLSDLPENEENQLLLDKLHHKALTEIQQDSVPEDENLIITAYKNSIDKSEKNKIVEKDVLASLEKLCQEITSSPNELKEDHEKLVNKIKKSITYCVDYLSSMDSGSKKYIELLGNTLFHIQSQYYTLHPPRMYPDTDSRNYDAWDNYQCDPELPPDFFQKKATEIMDDTALVISTQINDPEALFDHLIKDLGEKRKMIAEDQETWNARFFGKYRKGSISTPLMYRRYSEYGASFSKQMEALFFINDLMIDIPGSCDNPKIIHSATFGEYNFCLKAYTEKTEGIKFHVISAILTTENGEYNLSEYYIRNFDFGVRVTHTEADIMNPLMANEVKKAFKRCLPKSQSEEELKKNIAIFRFLFAHACPYNRGSAAIGEWFEGGLYRYHGKENIQYGDTIQGAHPTADLDALISLDLQQFVDTYKSKIELGPWKHGS